MKYYVKDYPRPQFVRDNWENLNGAWDFRFDDDNVGERDRWYEGFEKEYEIQVPFAYEVLRMRDVMIISGMRRRSALTAADWRRRIL